MRSAPSSTKPVFASWSDLLAAPRPAFWRGQTADTLFDRARNPELLPSQEALFTQSNARVLLGQAASGSLRLLALPTQLYPAPTCTGDLYLGPGMYHHSDMAMYVGDLSYQIRLEGRADPIDLSAEGIQNETWYADHVFPLTRARVGDLECLLSSVAPVAADARRAPLSPAPLPGPAGAFYTLIVRNTGDSTLIGKVVLSASDLLIGDYGDALPQRRALMRPDVVLRQQSLILAGHDGAVGLHLHDGAWTSLESPFKAERAFALAPGEQAVFETALAIGKTFHEVMPGLYDLHMRSALDWLNLTAEFWRSRLGRLEVNASDARDEATFSRDCYLRGVLDNFNCLQTDDKGKLVAHHQGAPSHGYGTVWGIDVEPTAVSIAHACPELTWSTLLFFMHNSRVPKGPADHSVPILVAPVILARQWLQVSGDVARLRANPEVLQALLSIMNDLKALKAPGEMLFSSRYSSDGTVGRRYDYGTNAKVWYAFDCMAFLLRSLGQDGEAEKYAQIAEQIGEAIERTMVVEGPFGRQYSGGTNLGEDTQAFYLPDDVLYYDGEDTSSMLAPIYGLCEFTHPPWINYHRFARSLWCPNFDPEFGALRWTAGEGANGALDGTGYFSRLGGSVTRQEMLEALALLREITDPVTGSTFWWPHGLEYRRALTRCSQGQGAWAWQYLQQWLGITVDAAQHMLTLAPQGLLTAFDWTGFRAGPHRFELEWNEAGDSARFRVKNLNAQPWTVCVCFRPQGSAATGTLAWQTHPLEAGQELVLQQALPARVEPDNMAEAALIRREAAAFGDRDGVIFKRFGHARSWGHWDTRKMWEARSLPLTLRLVVANASDQDWSDAVVTLSAPPGWQTQARAPRHWSRADALASGTVRLPLGRIAKGTRTVAPFWVTGPHNDYDTSGSHTPNGTFHSVSQPGEGLLLKTRHADGAGEVVFQAELRASSAGGRQLTRSLPIPVKIERL